MNANRRNRLDRIDRAASRRTGGASGVAVVRCAGAGCWDALPAAEREALIAAELGRPSRADDLVIALQVVPSGTQRAA